MKKIVCYFVAAIMAVGLAAVSTVEVNAMDRFENTAKPKKEYVTVEYDVHLHCENCVKKVKENISYEKGVKALEVSLEEQRVTVTYDPSKTDVKKLADAIRKLGYEVEVRKDGKGK